MSPPLDSDDFGPTPDEVAEWRRAEMEGAAEQARHEATGGWSSPTPLEQVELPPFPVHMLPPDLRAFVSELAIATQTPPDLSALLVLAAVSSALAKRAVVVVREEYAEPTNLFALVALPPANRKSTVFAEATAPLKEHERREVERLIPLIQDAQSRRAVMEKSKLRAIDNAAKAVDSEQRQALEGEIAQLDAEILALQVPAVPRLLASDATPEALGSLLVEQAGRIAVMDAEGGPFAIMAGRYSAAPNFEVFLKGHAGDDLRVDRRGRPPEFVDRPALTVALAVQPDVIRSLAKTPGFRGQGLLARFLYAIPTSLVGHRLTRPPTMRPATKERYHSRLLELLSMSPARTADGREVEHRIRLAPAAELVLDGFDAWLEPRLAGELALMSDWAGKLVGAVARIAASLHAASVTGAPWSTAVEKSTVEAAIGIGRYLIPHAQAAFALVGEDPGLEDARHVLRWLERSELDTFSKHDAFRATRGSLKVVDRVTAALRLLAEHGYVRGLAVPRSGPGRPSEMYERNPLWPIGQNGQKAG